MSTDTSEARIAKALAHPLRARILQRLGERVSSPGDLADELGAPLGVVSYHVRMLRDYECIELVRTEPRRGALQHFYRATARPTLNGDEWQMLPSGLRAELAAENLQKLVSDFVAANDGAFPIGSVERVDVEFDVRAVKQADRARARYVAELQAIAARSAERETKKFRYVVGVVDFERAE